ncbi:hypothetical protein HNS03_24605 [Amorphus sp. 3PC139-8]
MTPAEMKRAGEHTNLLMEMRRRDAVEYRTAHIQPAEFVAALTDAELAQAIWPMAGREVVPGWGIEFPAATAEEIQDFRARSQGMRMYLKEIDWNVPGEPPRAEIWQIDEAE